MPAIRTRLAVGLFLLLLLSHVSAFGATLYVSNIACANTYNVTLNNCTGSGITSYTNVNTADTASAVGDTINLRTVTSYSTASGIAPKDNTTWQTYPGDLPTRATITSTGTNIMTVGGPGVTIKELILTGGQQNGILATVGGSTLTVDHVEISGWNTSNLEFVHGIYIGGNSVGDGCHAGNLAGANKDSIIRNSYVHDAAFGTGGGGGIGAIAWGCSDSGHLVENNLVRNVPNGIWIDVDGGRPALGLVPHIVRNNVVIDSEFYCYHIEARSSAKFHHNVGAGCQRTAIFVRPGGTMEQLEIQHNTFVDFGFTGIHLGYEDTTYHLTDLHVDNNILRSSGTLYPMLLIGTSAASHAENTFRNNLFDPAVQSVAVCWNNGASSWFDCVAGGTSYANTSTGLNNWNSATLANNNLSGTIQLANVAGEDYRLCTGTNLPVSGCVVSPAVDAGVDVGFAFNDAAPDLGAFESGTAAASGFPEVAADVLSLTNPTNTAHAPTMPATIGANDTVILVMSLMGSPLATPSFTDAGWTIFSTISATDRRMVSAWRKGPPAGVTSTPVTTTTTTRAAFYAARITGATDPTVQPPQMSTGTTGDSGNPDPNSLTPTGGSKDYLWFAFAGFGVNTCSTTVGTYPAGYGSGQVQLTGGGSPQEANLGVARLAATGASQDPGAFALIDRDTLAACTTSTQMAATMAIHPAAAVGSGFTDDFTVTAMDPVWSVNSLNYIGSDALVTVTESGGQLRIQPRSGVAVDAYNGYSTVATYDLTGGSASVQVVQVSSVASAANTSLILSLNAANWFGFTQEANTLYMQALTGGVMSETSIPYTNATHRWWKIRHVPASNTITWETSTNGTTWTPRRTGVTPGFAITALSLEISAGTYTSVTTPTVAIFDDVTLSLDDTSALCPSPITGSPYPVSTHLCMDFNFATGLHAIDQAIGSDNWPMTWADDGHQYTSWGDGGGFGGTDAPNERVSLGYGRIEGATAASYVGVNICGDLDMAPFLCTIDGKSYGMISIAGILYSWVCPGTNTQCYDESRLYFSNNHAQSWTSTSVVFNDAQSLMIPTILNFGQNNAGARDLYMYSYFINTKTTAALSIQRPGEIVLARVPATSHASIINLANYEWFAGLDGSNNPIWTTTVASRVPVFVDTDRGVGWNVSVTHHPASGRYILVTEHSNTAGSSVGTFESNIGVFDASEPWGNPTGDKWTTLWYQNQWGTPTIAADGFYWTFAPKWFTPAGAFTMVFTGINTLDDWNAVNGTLTQLTMEDTIPPSAPTQFRVVRP